MQPTTLTKLLLVFSLLIVPGVYVETVSAQVAFGPQRALGAQWRTQRRVHMRPNVHVVRPRGADRFLAAGTRQTIRYSVMRGSVSHIEVRSGGRTLQTITLPPGSRSGNVTFTTPQGVRSFKLRAWQGMTGYQTVSAQSVNYPLFR